MGNSHTTEKGGLSIHESGLDPWSISTQISPDHMGTRKAFESSPDIDNANQIALGRGGNGGPLKSTGMFIPAWRTHGLFARRNKEYKRFRTFDLPFLPHSASDYLT